MPLPDRLHDNGVLGTVVLPYLSDMQFPDRSSAGVSKKRSDKIEIDLNDLLAQGVRRHKDKEAKKQERKEHRKWTKKGIAGPKDSLQNESNPAWQCFLLDILYVIV